MVRVAEGGVGRTAWAALHDVRLADHGSYPPTESLPFIPRLPQGTPDEMTRSATTGDLLGLSDFPEPVSPWAPRADAAASRTVRVTVTADEVGPGTGRHQAPAGGRHEGSDRDLRPSSLLDGVEPTRLLTLPAPHHWKTVAPGPGVFPTR